MTSDSNNVLEATVTVPIVAGEQVEEENSPPVSNVLKVRKIPMARRKNVGRKGNEESLGWRIAVARQNASLTQRELADKVDVSQATIHRLEAGVSPQCNKTAAIAAVCGVDAVWLQTGQGSGNGVVPGEAARIVAPSDSGSGWSSLGNSLGKRNPDSVPLIKKDALLLYLQSDGEEREEWIEEWVLPVRLLKSGGRVFAIKVAGDSMEPEFLEGEMVVFEMCYAKQHKSFIISSSDGRLPSLRELRCDNGIWILKPGDLRYPSADVDSTTQIFAKAVFKYKDYLI